MLVGGQVLKLVRLPQGISWASLYGTAALCGIGFTMSLFIGSLAFDSNDQNMLFDERLGILIGSFVSGLFVTDSLEWRSSYSKKVSRITLPDNGQQDNIK